MKQWLNGLLVGLAIGLIVSIFYHSREAKNPAKAAAPLMDKQLDELEDWWQKLPTERKIDLELSRLEDENRLDDEGEEYDAT